MKRFRIITINKDGSTSHTFFETDSASACGKWKKKNFPLLRKYGIKFVVQTNRERTYFLRTDYEEYLKKLDAILSASDNSI